MMRMHRQFSVQTPRKWVLGWLNVEICWNSTELSALLLLDGNERSSSLVILMPELGILMLSLLSHFLQLVWAFEPSQSCHPSFWLKWTCAIDFCRDASCASGGGTKPGNVQRSSSFNFIHRANSWSDQQHLRLIQEWLVKRLGIKDDLNFLTSFVGNFCVTDSGAADLTSKGTNFSVKPFCRIAPLKPLTALPVFP
jgi:hypothetical protein